MARPLGELYGYEQFRNERLPEDSGKTIGGGISIYIYKRWSTNDHIIYNHTDNHCEIMTIKCRPHWLPRKFSSIISISCYTHFTGKLRLRDATAATINTISSCVKEVDTKYPDACILLMGDFNQLPIKLPIYTQLIKKCTRNTKILNKCFTRVRMATVTATNLQNWAVLTIMPCI